MIQRIGEAVKIQNKQRDFWKFKISPKTPMLRSEIATHATFVSADGFAIQADSIIKQAHDRDFSKRQ